MAGKDWNGWKWPERAGIARNGRKWLEMARMAGNSWNGWKWLEMAAMAGHGLIWLEFA